MVTSDLSPEVEMRPFCACAMHPAIIIGTVRSLWTWLWGRYHVPQNAFLVYYAFFGIIMVNKDEYIRYLEQLHKNLFTAKSVVITNKALLR